jgi:uncharacterized membrane protein
MTRLAQFWLTLRSSLWFVPSVMVLGAVVLALALIRLDLYLPGRAIEGYARLLTTSPEGARAMLGAIAGSMVTVAGVVFSITIVTLSLASSQYSPRVLRGFMKDRTNQLVLGVFVGIFAYCIVVLGAIRTDTLTFVPSIAVLVGGVLALVGIGFLIRFIHHTAMSIQAANIVAAVADETLATIERLYREGPDSTRQEEAKSAAGLDDTPAGWRAVAAPETGYVQRLDHDALVGAAANRDLRLRSERRVGEFVIRGAPLLAVAGTSDVSAELREQLTEAYTIGRERTVDQDPSWGIRQIVDVAARALSPGVNDPTTAVTCIHYVTAVLRRLGECSARATAYGRDGRVRLVAAVASHAELAAIAFDDVRAGARGNVTVLKALLDAIDRLAVTPAHVRRLGLEHQLGLLTRTIERTVDLADERDALLATASFLGQRLARLYGEVPSAASMQ